MKLRFCCEKRALKFVGGLKSICIYAHTHKPEEKKNLGKLNLFSLCVWCITVFEVIWFIQANLSLKNLMENKTAGKSDDGQLMGWSFHISWQLNRGEDWFYSYLWQHFMGFKVPFFLEDKGCMPEIPNSWSLRRNLNRCMLKRRAWDSRVSSGGVSTTVVPHWCLCQEFHEGQESFSICNSVQNVTKPFQMEGKWNIDRKHLG